MSAEVRIVFCEACQSEGRIYVSDGFSWDDGPRERDIGPCEVCEGTGGEIVEVQPIDLSDLDQATGAQP